MKPKPKLLPLSKLTRPFLLKFFADPKKKWTMEEMEASDGVSRCAIGHVYHAVLGDAKARGEQILPVDEKLAKAFGVDDWLPIIRINNGDEEGFEQRTPRARILAALRAAGRKGE